MTDPMFPDNPHDDTGAQGGPKKRLLRSQDRMIAGVAGGIAEYFGLDPTLVRIAFVVSIILPGPQVLLYLLLWLVIPKR